MTQPPTSLPSRDRRRWLAAGLTVVAVLAASAAYGSSDTGAEHTVRLSAHRPLPAAKPVTPLAASPSGGFDGKAYALYARYNLTPTAVQVDHVGALLAVEADGSSREVGTVTSDMTGFSMSGHVLTATSKSDPDRVYWWQPGADVTDASYNEASVPAGDRYLTSAPDGWFVVDSDGNLIDEPARGGAPAILAQPFPGVSGSRIAAASGPTGLVVSDQSALAFVSYATGSVTPLDTSDARVSPNDGVYPMCWAVSDVDAACGSYDSGQTTGHPSIVNIFIDPIDGTAAVAQASSESCPGVPTVFGTAAAWRGCDDRLTALDASGVSTSHHAHSADPVAGLDGFLTDDRSGTQGLAFSADLQTSVTVLAGIDARVEASQFALTAGRLVWQEDDAGPTPATLTVHRRSVEVDATSGDIAAGPVRDVGDSHLVGAPLAAAGHTIAYGKKSTGNDNPDAATVRVVTPSTSVVLHNVDRDREVTVGDHRVVYDDATSERAHVFNIRNGHDSPLDSDTAVVSGHYLAYVEDEEILQKDLATGHIETVAYDVDVIDNGLFEHGDIVGWNATCYPVNGVTIQGAYRVTPSDTAPDILPSGEGIWALSDAGVITVGLVDPGHGAPSYLPTPPSLPTAQSVAFALRPYGSDGEKPILSGSYLDEGPQLHSGVLAWIDAKGRLEAQPLL